MLMVFALPVEALRAYLRWTFATTADNLLWGIWLGAGATLSLVNRLIGLPVMDGTMDVFIFRDLVGLATIWWWYGLGLLVVVYGVIRLTFRR